MSCKLTPEELAEVDEQMSPSWHALPQETRDRIDAALDAALDRELRPMLDKLEADKARKQAEQARKAEESALARVRRMINAPRTEGSN